MWALVRYPSAALMFAIDPTSRLNVCNSVEPSGFTSYEGPFILALCGHETQLRGVFICKEDGEALMDRHQKEKEQKTPILIAQLPVGSLCAHEGQQTLQSHGWLLHTFQRAVERIDLILIIKESFQSICEIFIQRFIAACFPTLCMGKCFRGHSGSTGCTFRAAVPHVATAPTSLNEPTEFLPARFRCIKPFIVHKLQVMFGFCHSSNFTG